MLSVSEIAAPVALSLTLALVVTVLLIVIATPIACWLCRSRWRGKESLVLSGPSGASEATTA